MEALHKNISDTKTMKHLTPLILIAFNMKKRAKNVVLLKTPIKYFLEYGIHFLFFFLGFNEIIGLNGSEVLNLIIIL